MVRVRVRVEDIDTQADTQSRAGMDDEVIASMEEALAAGKALPDLRLVGDGEKLWPYDGFHRIAAYLAAGVEEVWADVITGTLQDARWLACAANREHLALRRSNDDKRHTVQMALRLRPDMSDRAIAEHCGVSNPFVSEMRRQVLTVNTSAASTRTGRDGKEYPARREKKRTEVLVPGPTQAEGEAVLNGHADAPVHPPIANTPANARAAREAIDPPRDRLGAVLPPALRDFFQDEALPAVTAEVERAASFDPQKLFHRLAARRAALPYLLLEKLVNHLHAAAGELDDALSLLKAGAPHAVCPACAGHCCEQCRGVGYVTAWRLEELQREGVA